jgi:transposase-like protein
MSTEKPKVKCPRCKYEWVRRGKLQRFTCPNCGLTIKPVAQGAKSK